MEYLQHSRQYFKSFRDAHLQDYFESMKRFKVGGGSGFQYFDGSNEVNQTMYDIYGNLEDFYADLSIPGKFSSPEALIDSWVNFKNHLIAKGKIFEKIINDLIEEQKKSPFYNPGDPVESLLPPPLNVVNGIRLEVLDVLEHILAMEEVNSYLNPNSVPSLESIVETICRNFHRFCNQLGKRYDNRSTISVSDEYDVQDLLHSIFKLHFNDIRAEEYTPSYAGGASRIDFLISDEELAIEVKKTRAGLKDKSIGEQLIIDTGRYSAHPKCKKLICFVYDPELLIKNPEGIENDLSKSSNGIDVQVIISPKGN